MNTFISDGSYGVVSKISDEKVRKTFKDNACDESVINFDFVKEVIALKKLESTGLVPKISKIKYQDEMSLPYFEMTFYELSLDQFIIYYLDNIYNLMDENQYFSIIIQVIKKVFDCLTISHEYGIIHNDLKPSNIMLNLKDNLFDNAVLIDWGISVFTYLNYSIDSFTTRGYNNPNKKDTKRGKEDDWWALSILLIYSLLKRPYNCNEIVPNNKIEGEMNDILSIGLIKGKLSKRNSKKMQTFINSSKYFNKLKYSIFKKDLEKILKKFPTLINIINKPCHDNLIIFFEKFNNSPTQTLFKNNSLTQDNSIIFENSPEKNILITKLLFKVIKMYNNFDISIASQINILSTFRKICIIKYDKINKCSLNDFFIIGCSLIHIICNLREYENIVSLNDISNKSDITVFDLFKCSKYILRKHHFEIYDQTLYEKFVNVYKFINPVIIFIIKIHLINQNKIIFHETSDQNLINQNKIIFHETSDQNLIIEDIYETWNKIVKNEYFFNNEEDKKNIKMLKKIYKQNKLFVDIFCKDLLSVNLKMNIYLLTFDNDIFRKVIQENIYLDYHNMFSLFPITTLNDIKKQILLFHKQHEIIINHKFDHKKDKLILSLYDYFYQL